MHYLLCPWEDLYVDGSTLNLFFTSHLIIFAPKTGDLSDLQVLNAWGVLEYHGQYTSVTYGSVCENKGNLRTAWGLLTLSPELALFLYLGDKIVCKNVKCWRCNERVHLKIDLAPRLACCPRVGEKPNYILILHSNLFRNSRALVCGGINFQVRNFSRNIYLWWLLNVVLSS